MAIEINDRLTLCVVAHDHPDWVATMPTKSFRWHMNCAVDSNIAFGYMLEGYALLVFDPDHLPRGKRLCSLCDQPLLRVKTVLKGMP